MKKSLRKIATGVGVVGMLGVGGLALENQGYQQGTGSQQSSQGGQQGTQQGSQHGQQGAGTSATSQSEQGGATSQREMQGQTGQSQRGSSESSSMGQQQGSSYESGRKHTASAQGEAMRGEKERSGRIRSVDSSSQTLTLKGPRMRHQEIAWSDRTQVLKNGKSVSPEELSKGERVRVTYRNEGGKLVASQIQIGERRQARTSRRSHQETNR